MKDSSIEENEDTVYLILALSGDTSMSAMLCIPSVVVTERLLMLLLLEPSYGCYEVKCT